MEKVTHGLMSRVFLMKWYHFSVEYFEDLRNVNHCEFLIMRQKEDSGKYILENNLRTWSELKRERLAAAATKEKSTPSSPVVPSNISEKDKEKEKKLVGGGEVSQATAGIPIPVRKKWGGCPNGCDHGKHHYHKKGDNSMHAMALNNGKAPSPTTQHLESLPFRRPAARRWQSSSEEDEDDPRGRVGPPAVDIQRSLDEIVSSPDGTPSFISLEDRLRSRMKSPRNDLLLVKTAGRDFGGSASGNTSQAGSDTEFSPAEETLKKIRGSKKKLVGGNSVGLSRPKGAREESGMGRGTMADALGDQSDIDSGGSEAELDVEVLDEKEKEERSVRGSVY
jgi:hypothetical protein